ncbi:5-amino-6-(5-phosphoribosylamino)uracil reductase [Fusarium odoratissimum]|uniref:2,5-diamino-6-ribosylamino-4(3H)-pyrimidinone 5'-phosphate reductase n=1 Tax=Fusarium oxysporum f. sp. cubense (strain race 4) TaxID=2502994 RepID=N1R644_FUSC4|nr:5-amino-6-(5-phosphoribosylamino)uracil reductase [Fusarium odoratissimum]
MSELTFPASSAAMLESRLPPSTTASGTSRPFVTLTFATSLDSSLSLAPGVRTRLSGPDSKAMTHYLRSRHDAILIGVSTLLADSPALNCRITGATSQPRPIVIDPHLRWAPSSSDKVLEVSRLGNGLAPFVLTGLSSVMVEGGGQIINSLLDPQYHELVDSIIITIAPTWLGQGGVVVSPDRLAAIECLMASFW